MQVVRKNNGTPIGYFVAARKDNDVFIGWSKCCKKDCFRKTVGRAYAISRLNNSLPGKMPTTFKLEFAAFVDRCYRYYKDVNKIIVIDTGRPLVVDTLYFDTYFTPHDWRNH